MISYAEFRPTGFDTPGAFLDDRQDWIVAPVGRTRDSGPMEESNFEAALALLGGESDTMEVHQFGHWGCGWFEIILAHPSRASEVEAIESRLEDYPLLDEDDASNREYEEYLESWGDWAASDFRSALAKEFDLADPACEALDAIPDDDLRAFFEECNHSGEFYWAESGGVRVNIKSSVRGCSRDDLAKILATYRAARWRPAS